MYKGQEYMYRLSLFVCRVNSIQHCTAAFLIHTNRLLLFFFIRINVDTTLTEKCIMTSGRGQVGF